MRIHKIITIIVVLLMQFVILSPKLNANDFSINNGISAIEETTLDWNGNWGGQDCSRSRDGEFGPRTNDLFLQWSYKTKYPEYICTSGDYIIITKSEREIVCLSMLDGAYVWSFSNQIDKKVNLCLPPISFDGKIVFASGAGVTCFKADSGEKLWEYECDVESYFISNPAQLDDKIYVISFNDRQGSTLHSIDVDNGKKQSTEKLALTWNWRNRQQKIVTNGDIYYITNWWGVVSSDSIALEFFVYESNISNNIQAFDIKTKVNIWSFEPEYSIGSVASYPAIYDDKVFCVYKVKTRSGQKNVLYCLNLKNGHIIWENDIESAGSIIVCGQRIYVGDRAYSTSDGTKLTNITTKQEPIAVANRRFFTTDKDAVGVISSATAVYRSEYTLYCYVDSACLSSSTGDTLNLGRYCRQTPPPQRFTVKNCADFEYELHVSSDEDWFSTSNSTFSLKPGEEKQILVRPNHQQSGKYTGKINIRHDNRISDIDVTMEILSSSDVISSLTQTQYYEFQNVEVASSNSFELMLSNPLDEELNISIQPKDAWILIQPKEITLDPGKTTTISVQVDPKRLYMGGLEVLGSFDLVLLASRKTVNVSLTTKNPPIIIDGWNTAHGNNSNTNYSNCTINEFEPPELWRAKLGYYSVISEPIVAKGKVYVGTDDGKLHCLDAATGKKYWDFNSGKTFTPEGALTPSIDGDYCVFTVDQAIFCINKDTGKKIWSTSIDSTMSPPTIAENKVFVSAGDSYPDYNGKIVCFDLTNGSVLWTTKTGYSYSKPAYLKGKVFIQTSNEYSLDDGFKGFMYSINTSNGQINWKKQGDFHENHVSIYNNRIYSINSIYIMCYNPDNGNKIWQSVDFSLYNDPLAIYNNRIATTNWSSSDENSFIAVDSSNGIAKLVGEKRSKSYLSPIVTNNLALFTTLDGRLNAIDYFSGTTYYWSKYIGSACYEEYAWDCDYHTKFSVADSLIYYGTEDGYLYCLGSINKNDEKTTDKNKYKLTYKLDSQYYWLQIPGGNDDLFEMSAKPKIISGSTYLPAKYVVEPLGGTVLWDGNERKVTCKLGNTTIELWIGNKQAKVNGVPTNYDSIGKLYPQIVDGRTMVPMRFIAENLGCEVFWLASERGIVITR